MASIRRASVSGTAIVVAYELTIFAHGASHARLGIGISAAQSYFIWGVMEVSPLLADGAPVVFVAADWALRASAFDGRRHSFRSLFPFRRARSGQRTPAGIGSVACDFRDNCLPVAAIKGCGRFVGVWFLRGSFGTHLAE